MRVTANCLVERKYKVNDTFCTRKADCAVKSTVIINSCAFRHEKYVIMIEIEFYP